MEQLCHGSHLLSIGCVGAVGVVLAGREVRVGTRMDAGLRRVRGDL